MTDTVALSIGITTRNRPDALARCLASLDILESMAVDVLVFDDGSEPPVGAVMVTGRPVRVLRDASSPGYIVGRNRLMCEASSPMVLLLDDDTRVLSAASVQTAIGVLERDPAVGAVAFAQAEVNGSPWPARMQPSRVDYPCVIPSFIGFAHLLRRDAFLALHGYREDFVYYGEEKDYCLRLIDAGYRTVYLPRALVSHIPDVGGRSRTRYLRFVSRNDCLNAMYNYPLPRALWTVPMRVALYFWMRRTLKIDDPWGWVWLLREIGAAVPRAAASRRPVSGSTLRLWRTLRRHPEPYDVREIPA